MSSVDMKPISEKQFNRDLDELAGHYEFVNGVNTWVINVQFRRMLKRYIQDYTAKEVSRYVKLELQRTINQINAGKAPPDMLSERLESLS